MEDRENPASPQPVERGLVTDVLVPVAQGVAQGVGIKAGADAYTKVKETLTPKPKAKSPIILPPGAERE